jgi:hypothetical protein
MIDAADLRSLCLLSVVRPAGQIDNALCLAAFSSGLFVKLVNVETGLGACVYVAKSQALQFGPNKVDARVDQRIVSLAFHGGLQTLQAFRFGGALSGIRSDQLGENLVQRLPVMSGHFLRCLYARA